MKAISLWQPYASLIALGAKRVETRTWQTRYCGPLAIHATKRKMNDEDFEWLYSFAVIAAREGHKVPIEPEAYPLGVVVCTSTLRGCHYIIPHMTRKQSVTECMAGNWSRGRYAWFLEDVTPLEPPVPAKGAQGLWEWRP